MGENQKTRKNRSLRIVKTLRFAIGVCGILIMAGLFLYNIGISQDIDQTLAACVVTEDGQGIPCEVRITGEVTVYPLKDKSHKRSCTDDGEVTVYANGNRLGILSFDAGNEEFTYGETYPAVYVMRRDLGIFFAQTDVARIFPEKESQLCVIAAPSENKADAIALLKAQDIPSHYESNFRWVLEQ